MIQEFSNKTRRVIFEDAIFGATQMRVLATVDKVDKVHETKKEKHSAPKAC
jgi:hypothetical protein